MKNKYHIFFSYSHRDARIGSELALKLENYGIRCFMAAKDILMGDWESHILEGLKSSEYVVPFLTRHSIHSDWVKREEGAAWGLEKTIIPLLMGVDPQNLPEYLQKHQCYLYESDSEREEFVSFLKKLISGRKKSYQVRYKIKTDRKLLKAGDKGTTRIHADSSV